MTLDEAIEVLQGILEYGIDYEAPHDSETPALKLGIAALARVKTLREQNGAANYPLFGETGDESLPVQEQMHA